MALLSAVSLSSWRFSHGVHLNSAASGTPNWQLRVRVYAKGEKKKIINRLLNRIIKVGQIERVISGDRLDEKELTGYREEEEDSEIIDASAVPQIKVRESYGLSPELRKPNSPAKAVHFEFSSTSSSASIDNHIAEEDVERRINHESDNEKPTTMTFTLKDYRPVEVDEDSVAEDGDMITTTSF